MSKVARACRYLEMPPAICGAAGQGVLSRRRAETDARGGFTLAVLMIAVVIIGLLAAISLTAFGRYVRKARNAEAVGHLDKLIKGAIAYYEADHADPNTNVQPKQFPSPGSILGVAEEPDCCARP